MPPVHDPAIPYLNELLTFLVTALIVVPVSRMLRISPILGFLGVGVVVGPSVLGIATDADNIEALAELGVVFLMFTIGLELSLDRLWKARRYVFGLGALQLAGCAAAIGGLAYLWGNPPEASLLLGLSMALSSTAVVMQLLVERGQISSRPGRAAFAILLFQDLAVVPLLFLVGVLSEPGEGSKLLSFGVAMLKAAGCVLVILLLGRLLLRPLFRAVAALRSPEVFLALTLLAILGTALATDEAGLSMALGAFLAGLLLSESEFRHQIEADIQPFKGLLLGLFFISVGLRIDLSLVVDRWPLVLAAVAGLYMIKTAIIAGLARLWRFPLGQSMRIGLYLGQGGEFAFVVVAAAVSGGIMATEPAQFMLVVTGLTMVLTPFASLLGDALGRRSLGRAPVGGLPEEFGDLDDHVVIAGFGRVGRTVGRMLTMQKVPYVALDLDAESLAPLYRAGAPVFFGDARRVDILDKVRVEQASSLVITLDDPAAVRQCLAAAHERWPHLTIFVRARDMDDARELMKSRSCTAVPEMMESSLQLAAEVLRGRGLPDDAILPLVDSFRQQIYTGIKPSAEERE
ncbi:monovalent cation:proton antiporter-2 (CPA2) family protein [Iodidimonas sp. SYSU 1G8]|uniref:monovalent cation:proton antiporter-2 (CPA2) family protein n=1 Tax=Iodidimonas sp. SYSU 1G8 TaxID=3133967 RepID=UPI0031FE66D9